MQYLRKPQFHSIIFSLITLIAIAFSSQLTVIHQSAFLPVLAACIIVLGIPHGSLDTLFAQQCWQLNTAKSWLLFLLGYASMAALVVWFWVWQPLLFFIGFIIISVIHFGDDLPNDAPLAVRILYGGAIIVLPALFYEQQIAQLFSYFIAARHANTLAQILHMLAFIWALGIMISCFSCAKTNQYTSLEIASVGLLALLAAPLFAFTLYFCGMHSLRHLLRSDIYLCNTSIKIKCTALILPTILVFLVAALCWPLLQAQAFNTKLIQLLFVSLAALTVPHMLLLHLSGFTSWNKI